MTVTVTPAVLQAGLTLTTSSAAMVIAPANTTVRINTMVFANTSSAASDTITVTRTASGGGAVTIINAATIQPNQSIVPKELIGMVLAPGDRISASATAGSAVNCFASGYNITTS